MRNVILKALPATFGKFKIVSVSDAIEISVSRPSSKEEFRQVGRSITEEQARAVCANHDYSVRVIA